MMTTSAIKQNDIESLQEIRLKAKHEITARVLTPDDAESLREVRLRCLREEGKYFTANLQEEEAMTKTQWQAAATETTKHVMVGVFDEDRLVGIMGAKNFDKDPTGKTAYYRGQYVIPEYRHLHLGLKLYEMLAEWAKPLGYTHAVYTIRAGNTRSIKVSEEHGAKAFAEEPLRFADGATVKAIWYEKRFG